MEMGELPLVSATAIRDEAGESLVVQPRNIGGLQAKRTDCSHDLAESTVLGELGGASVLEDVGDGEDQCWRFRDVGRRRSRMLGIVRE